MENFTLEQITYLRELHEAELVNIQKIIRKINDVKIKIKHPEIYPNTEYHKKKLEKLTKDKESLKKENEELRKRIYV